MRKRVVKSLEAEMSSSNVFADLGFRTRKTENQIRSGYSDHEGCASPWPVARRSGFGAWDCRNPRCPACFAVTSPTSPNASSWTA